MTQSEFNEFLKHNGFVLYRGRRFMTPNDTPIGEAQGIYLWNVNDKNKWFVAGRAELLTSAFVYIPKEQQLMIDELADIIATTVIKTRRAKHEKEEKEEGKKNG